jgi:(R,R)-butanediol dehydrogenase/meso-butanediol dehydrogenase/diacetyl reductase
MRAALLSQGQFRIEELPEPVPTEDQVVLSVDACGICGTDHSLWRAPGLAPDTILGHEFAGRVVQIGRAVREWEEGDAAAVLPIPYCGRCELCTDDRPNLCRSGLRAMMGCGATPGALAERICVPTAQLRRIPGDLDPARFALVEPLAVAQAAVDLGRITAGTRVGILGLGPLGLFAGLIAKERGALVFGTDHRPDRVRTAHSLGLGAFVADGVADERLRDLTLGGPEVVIEASGKDDAIDRAGSITRIGGRVVMVASYHAHSKIEPGHWVDRGISLLPSIAYTPQQFDEAVAMVASQAIDVSRLVSSVHRLDEVNEVFASFRLQTDQIKLLISPGS